MAQSERRRYARFQIPLDVVVKGHGLDEACPTEEVGMGGCRLTLSRRLPEGTTLHVEIRSPHAAEPLAGAAQVAWVTPTAPFHTGLAFAPALVEAMGPFLRTVVGNARITT
ncbi:MAG TPA: PilZ domain-containing protein [Anaeromyxobacter sp.]|nr:PilZ domain-containing protein [Anaeromyxobacter sp.]